MRTAPVEEVERPQGFVQVVKGVLDAIDGDVQLLPISGGKELVKCAVFNAIRTAGSVREILSSL